MFRQTKLYSVTTQNSIIFIANKTGFLSHLNFHEGNTDNRLKQHNKSRDVQALV